MGLFGKRKTRRVWLSKRRMELLLRSRWRVKFGVVLDKPCCAVVHPSCVIIYWRVALCSAEYRRVEYHFVVIPIKTVL